MNPSSSSRKKLQDLLKNGFLKHLIDILSNIIFSIIIINRDEIIPERGLLHYCLNSLFSLKLRNWIRRALDVDMALKDITSARDLKAPVGRILPLTRSIASAGTPPQSTTVGGELIQGSSSQSVEGGFSQALPISPLLGVEAEESESIQKHLELIGIDISNVQLVLPCAPLQEGIFFDAQLKSQGLQYFECLTLRITPKVPPNLSTVTRSRLHGKPSVRLNPCLELSTQALHQV